jgi:hypothetical protein
MDLESLANRIWFDSKLPMFVERFRPNSGRNRHPAGHMNQFRLSWDQRLALFLAVSASAYFIATVVHRTKQPSELQSKQQALSTAPDLPPSNPITTPPTAAPFRPDPPSLSFKDKAVENPPKKPPSAIKQHSEGPNSPNIVTFGHNSPVTINQRLPAWTLNSVQQQAVSNVVRSHRSPWDGKFDVIVCNLGDAESIRMAEAFVAAFRAGGWQLPHGGYGQAISTPTPVGVSVSIPGVIGVNEAPPELMPFLRELSGVLRATGVITDLLDVGINAPNACRTICDPYRTTTGLRSPL